MGVEEPTSTADFEDALGSATEGICAFIKDPIGKLKFPDVADEVFDRRIGDSDHGRHIAEPPVVLGYAVAHRTADTHVRVMAGLIYPVD